VQEKDDRTGKLTVRKIGLAPVMRDGIEYEFTVFMELDAQHQAFVSKDRTRLLDGSIIRPDVDTGRQLLTWLETGEEEIKHTPTMDAEQKAQLLDSIQSAGSVDQLFNAFSNAYRTANAIGDQQALTELTSAKDARKAQLEAHADDIFGVHA
jgi:hypothetical protein